MSANDPRFAASIEATPKQILEGDDLAGLFPAGTSVYLTDLGIDDTPRMVAAARRVADLGYNPVPHLASRRYASVEAFEARIRGFAGEAGVDDVLVIGGEADRAGCFASSMELLETGILDAHGIRRIGVAGHPEGNPAIPEGAVREALSWKKAFAERTGAEMRIVTQFGFDAPGIVAWADRLAADGFDLPVHIGIAGPAKVTTLIKYAAICGVGASLKFLKKRAGALAALATVYTPDGVVQALESEYAGSGRGPIAQMHIFPFGGLRRASEWLYERGSWSREETSAVPFDRIEARI